MSGAALRTLCQLCHTNCGLTVEKGADGQIKVKGDPGHPVNRGHCCPKAVANAEIQRSPDRLKYPLLKTKAGFKRISWDEALDIAAGKLGEIRSQWGPFSLVRYAGAPVSYQGRDGFLEFMGAYGSPNNTSVGNICMLPRMMAFKAVTGGMRAEPDYANTAQVIFWGSNPLGVQRVGSYAAFDGWHRVLPRLKERGVRTICLDPYNSKTAKQADEWIRIKPGSDTALGLAMIQVIIEQGLYDRDFVTAHGHGFEALRDHVKGRGPSWAEKPTGIPAAAIENLARSYASVKPSAIYEGNGLDMYANGVEAVRTIAILIGLTGNLDAPGGNVFMPFPHPAALPTRPAPRQERLGFDHFPIPPNTPFPAVKEALLSGREDRPRTMIVHHGNPVLTQANTERTRQAFANLDFLMVCEIFPTATTELADLVLPITTDFEAYGYRAYSSLPGGFLALARPVADVQGQARSVFEVEYELAGRMGLGEGYPFHDDRTWIDYMVKPNGVTFERLETEQIVFTSPEVQYRKYLEKGFDTPSGKLEFHSLWFEKSGAPPLPDYNYPAGEPLEPEALAAKGFSLLGSSRRLSQFVHTRFKNLEKISKSYPRPLVYMHPEDAVSRNISDGGEVEVSSPQGRITLQAKISRDTTEGLVWIDFGWGNPTDGLANINSLTNDWYCDPISGGTPNRIFPCEVALTA